jgi:hypothetical protein
MEDRSSRRMRTLVTRKARRGLSANEIACALISMMARSTCSNQRPDTLMQDLLQRTAGPYIRVKIGKAWWEQMSSAWPPRTDMCGDGVVGASASLSCIRGRLGVMALLGVVSAQMS